MIETHTFQQTGVTVVIVAALRTPAVEMARATVTPTPTAWRATPAARTTVAGSPLTMMMTAVWLSKVSCKLL